VNTHMVLLRAPAPAADPGKKTPGWGSCQQFPPLKRPFGGIPAYLYFQTQPDVSWTPQTRNSWHDAGAVLLKLPQLAITAAAVLVVGRMSCFDGCFGWLSGRHVAFMYKWLPYHFHVLPPHQQCETREILPRPATKMSFCSHLVAHPTWRFWSQVPRKAKRSLLMSRSWFCPQAKRLAGLKGILLYCPYLGCIPFAKWV
jgi:hypothetical protein